MRAAAAAAAVPLSFSDAAVDAADDDDNDHDAYVHIINLCKQLRVHDIGGQQLVGLTFTQCVSTRLLGEGASLPG
eukprot:1137505-Pelagomonas_calceolata.AAC.5